MLEGEHDLVVLATGAIDPEVVNLCVRMRRHTPVPMLLLVDRPVDEASYIQAYEAGVDECVVVPIGHELLRAKLAAWLRWSPRMDREAYLRAAAEAGGSASRAFSPKQPSGGSTS